LLHLLVRRFLKKVFEEVSERPFAFRTEILPERIAGDGYGSYDADVHHGGPYLFRQVGERLGKTDDLSLALTTALRNCCKNQQQDTNDSPE
jgi:hypothetical protein